jgi:hypothetical protein
MHVKDQDLKYFRGVKILDLSYCPFITTQGLEHLKRVKVLDLTNCDVSQEGLVEASIAFQSSSLIEFRSIWQGFNLWQFHVV